MPLTIIFLVLGVVLLAVSGKIINRALLSIAEQLHISGFIVALVLVSFSTSIPELSVAIGSALDHAPALSLGDVFGSNIVNLTLVAGLVSIISRKNVSLQGEITKLQGLWIFALGALPVFLLLDGQLSRLDGVILLSAFVVFVARLIKDKRAVLSEVKQAEKIVLPVNHDNFFGWITQRINAKKELLTSIGIFSGGVMLLLFAAWVTLKMALIIATGLNIPPFLIGLFVIAIGTSLPEITFGIRVALSGKPELSFGDLLGSTAVNSTLILGVAAIIYPIVPVSLSSVLTSGMYMIAVFVVFYLLMNRGGVIRPRDGALLIFLYIIFLVVEIRLMGMGIH